MPRTQKIARLKAFLNVYGIVSILLFGGLFSPSVDTQNRPLMDI